LLFFAEFFNIQYCWII